MERSRKPLLSSGYFSTVFLIRPSAPPPPSPIFVLSPLLALAYILLHLYLVRQITDVAENCRAIFERTLPKMIKILVVSWTSFHIFIFFLSQRNDNWIISRLLFVRGSPVESEFSKGMPKMRGKQRPSRRRRAASKRAARRTTRIGLTYMRELASININSNCSER